MSQSVHFLCFLETWLKASCRLQVGTWDYCRQNSLNMLTQDKSIRFLLPTGFLPLCIFSISFRIEGPKWRRQLQSWWLRKWSSWLQDYNMCKPVIITLGFWSTISLQYCRKKFPKTSVPRPADDASPHFRSVLSSYSWADVWLQRASEHFGRAWLTGRLKRWKWQMCTAFSGVGAAESATCNCIIFKILILNQVNWKESIPFSFHCAGKHVHPYSYWVSHIDLRVRQPWVLRPRPKSFWQTKRNLAARTCVGIWFYGQAWRSLLIAS